MRGEVLMSKLARPFIASSKIVMHDDKSSMVLFLNNDREQRDDLTPCEAKKFGKELIERAEWIEQGCPQIHYDSAVADELSEIAEEFKGDPEAIQVRAMTVLLKAFERDGYPKTAEALRQICTVPVA
jgi:hypothetical protein